MENTIQNAFERLIQSELTLTSTQISRGSTSHNYIRELLSNKNTEDSSFPRLIDGDFLSGSYARGTKIHPLDDIDVMIIMDGTGLSPISEGVIVDADVRGSGDSNNPLLAHLGADNRLSSRRVLDLFKLALQKSHPNSEIKKHGQAINVWLDSSGMGIDVVPCMHIVPRDGSRDYYYIPMGENSDQWMTTNPKIDKEISDSLHEEHNKLFKGFIRLIKYWNKVSNRNRLQSYHLETVAWHTFDSYEGRAFTYEDDLIHFFSEATAQLSISCADKTVLDGPID